MTTSPEREAEIQERSEAVLNAFESQDFPTAVAQFAEAVHTWTREGNAEAATDLADRVEVYRDKLPEDLVNRFDVKLGEAHLYSGTAENGSLQRAEEAYQRVADVALPERPLADAELTEEERRHFSEHFHALDRLGDVAFSNGEFAAAAQRYAEANDARGPAEGLFAEPGPRACATYGEAASAFVQGDVETCQEKIDDALQALAGKEAEEQALVESIQSLEVAAGTLEQLESNERERVLENIQEKIVARGGASGGVKRMNFRELTEVSVVEVRDGQN